MRAVDTGHDGSAGAAVHDLTVPTRPIPIARGANAGRAPLMPTRIAMRSRFERAFEAVLWNSRFVVMLAVLGSVAAALALFWITSVDLKTKLARSSW